MTNSKYVEKISENFSKIMEGLGDYLINIGNVEKEDPEFKIFLDKMKSDSSYFDNLIKEMPAELSKDFLFVFVKMIGLQDKAKDLERLSPDEKIKLGNELKNLAKRFKDLDTKLKSLGIKK